ncbi:NlpC/P60 family protein [Jeotgalibacillus sp. S-D1]|uniref:C40 family peptidase n=1 Tax=Jeotgalibacillus sp. S-D1 TaxID=2552189 RepID=UPI00105971CC|nr:C40 family peptidase [Jeotgalibacillus sp. S-D1]TDL33108.1 NlpC/P60 family protein [Jeotgalibacillus sp. S-D1]
MEICAAQINVTAATLWTEASSPRSIDEAAIQHPVNLQKWLDGLSGEERKALLDENRIQSQILYNELVYIIEEKDSWAKVVIPNQSTKKDERGYPGWIPLVQLTKLEQEDAESLLEMPIAVITKHTSLVNQDGKEIIPLSFNTVLPVLTEAGEAFEVLTPHGPAYVKKTDVLTYESVEAIAKKNGESIIHKAERFLNLDYLWGGLSDYGYDCSGFTYTILKACGYIIPRDAGDQAKKGKWIDKKDVQPGDLLFFAYEEGKGRLHHVGIYYGEGKMIHSPTPGKKILIQTIEGSFYEKEWCETRRYWQE